MSRVGGTQQSQDYRRTKQPHRWLSPLLRTRARQDVRQAVVALMARDFVHPFVSTPQIVLHRPWRRVRIRIGHRQTVVDGVVVDPRESLDEAQVLRRALKQSLVVEV